MNTFKIDWNILLYTLKFIICKLNRLSRHSGYVKVFLISLYIFLSQAGSW